MARRNDTAPRDADLDERPFGDSHFGAVRREQRGLERARLSVRATPSGEGPSPDRPNASTVYAWHEGCFEDVSPGAPRMPRAARPSARGRAPATKS